jgi:tetratricopeptide (TPR) repeat protein
VVAAHPDDPRAHEALAAAYSFAQDRALPADDAARVPAGATQRAHFAGLALTAMETAIKAPRLEHYFPGADDRAPFHRRLSYQLLKAGRPDLSLAQAEIARELQPESFNTWRRLAQAYRALERPADAINAYQRAEALLPEGALTRRVHFAEFGDLLMATPGRDQDACPKFAAALQLEPPSQLAEPAVWREAGTLALLGAARCHIRFGEGAEGFEIARQVLAADPTRTQAWLVVGEYHLRSQHFEQAIAAYGEVVRNQPAHYEALRGLHESLFHADRLPEAIAAWQAANEARPGDDRLAGFRVWACALAADARTAELAAQLATFHEDAPFACLAMSLEEWRAGRFSSAIDWVERAARGRPAPEAREFERAAAGIRLLRKRRALGPEGLVLEAAVCGWGPFPDSARRHVKAELAESDASGWPHEAWTTLERVARRLSDVSESGE